ncbi:MAG: hypothetical protein ACRDJK_03025, partial [Actinomycetota bacterium]
ACSRDAGDIDAVVAGLARGTRGEAMSFVGPPQAAAMRADPIRYCHSAKTGGRDLGRWLCMRST